MFGDVPGRTGLRLTRLAPTIIVAELFSGTLASKPVKGFFETPDVVLGRGGGKIGGDFQDILQNRFQLILGNWNALECLFESP